MQNLIDLIRQEALAMGWLDWVVTITALIYVWLAAREKIQAWFWGIISCSMWAYASFVKYDLWLDGLLQVFYVGMGFWAIYSWRQGGEENDSLPVSRLPLRTHLIILLAGSAPALAFGYFFAAYTPAAATYPDAFTTVFALIATWLLVRKILANWIYWIAIDLAYIFIYSSRGAYLFALIMLIYVVIAADGFRRWRTSWRQEMRS